MRRIFLFLLVVACFGSIGILSHYMREVPSPTITFIRAAFSAIVFYIIFEKKIKIPKDRKIIASYALQGVFIAIAFTTYVEAFRHADVSEIALLGFIDPVLVTLLAAYALREKITTLGAAAVLFAAAGIISLFSAKSLALDLGITLGCLAMGAGAAMSVLARWEERKNESLGEVLFFPFVFAAAFTLLPAALSPDAASALNERNILPAITLAAATVAGYWGYDKLMLHYGAHATDLAVRVGITIFATVLAYYLFGQKVGGQWALSALMLLGAGLFVYFERHTDERKFLHRHHGHTH